MDAADEIEELLEDIDVLRGLIDVALDRGVVGDDVLLRACAQTLRERRERLEQLERSSRTA